LKQIVQSVRDGKLRILDVPAPVAQPNHVVIANACSLLSAGTEKILRDLAQKSLVGKAAARPDHVKRVLEKVRNEGLLNTIHAVMTKLDEPMPLGYSSAGVVLACGAGVEGIRPGDRVASNGPHAGVVSVPKHLCALVPEGVPFDHAAFGVVGAIALQGVRLAQLALGETAFVIGLGLIGQITVALLKAQGCRVLGSDLSAARCEEALRMGADVARVGLGAADVEELTRGLGADAVVITASTESDGPVLLASNAVRKKGRIVALGAVGLHLDRRPLYSREAELVVSCSYGPGRYDANYEDRGHDYPAPYVRWTEQRNLQAILDLMAAKRLDVEPLITHRFDVADAERAYDLIESRREPFLGVLLRFADAEETTHARRVALATAPAGTGAGFSCLGAGNFARAVLLPALAKTGLVPRVLCSAGGLSAVVSGEKHGFAAATTDEDELFADEATRAVFVLTRHDQHARLVLRALASGKAAFTEKPLALTLEEIAELDAAVAAAGPAGPMLMVGFNRRFSPAARAARAFLASTEAPLAASIRFNAGAIPADHWTQDEAVGGGRIVGEACHAIDLATYLVGAPVVRVYAEAIGGPTAPEITNDQVFITLRHANGSVSSVAYLAGGDKAFPKERVEVIGGGRVVVIDDFRLLTTCAHGKTQTRKFDLLGGQDKGHRAEIAAFADALTKGDAWPIPWPELRATSAAAILAVRSLREGTPFDVLG